MSAGEKSYSFGKLIDAICNRPCMFTMTETFAEVATYINAFTKGLAHADPSIPTEWTGFQEWLRQKWDYPNNHSWCFELKKRFPEDKMALEQLLLLYQEFVAEMKNPEEESH